MNKRKLFLSLALFLMAGSTLSAQNKSAGINLSIWKGVSTQPADSAQTTYFNLGILSAMNRLNGAGFNAFGSVISHNMNGIQASGLANMVGGTLRNAMAKWRETIVSNTETQTTETESQTQETQTTETKKPEETQKKEETQKTEETQTTESTEKKEDTQKSDSKKSTGTVKTKDICNVRKSPSTDGELLGKVDIGVELKKLGTEGDWTKVKFQGETGYVKSEFVKEVSSKSGSGKETVKTKDICNVRKTASTDGELLGKVDAGVKLKKLGTKGEWTKVKFQGKTGYIKSDLLKTVK